MFLETALGIEIQSQTKQNSVVDAIDEIFRMTGDRMTSCAARLDFMYKLMPCFKHYEESRQLLYAFVKEVRHLLVYNITRASQIERSCINFINRSGDKEMICETRT